AKDLKRNALIVAQGHEHPRLFAKTLIANQLHWINQIPSIPLSCTAKIRYRQPDQACRIQAIEKNQAIVSFDQSQRAITPGQSVVFYQENECLGGGVIVE
ncbi:MAG: tRNA 2-thiouridine(34) synthase MnmA, partial [Gammaproteobacteria bacterium]|nr:tRNA 2-thiouridine(34) synthase MnmA [Gammaproteobacteria bacterium]